MPNLFLFRYAHHKNQENVKFNVQSNVYCKKTIIQSPTGKFNVKDNFKLYKFLYYLHM